MNKRQKKKYIKKVTGILKLGVNEAIIVGNNSNGLEHYFAIGQRVKIVREDARDFRCYADGMSQYVTKRDLITGAIKL